jgi:carboxyl-terminal processing protease
VNEFSASASEIFAAAIQDYGRGVVIGSTSTYGKGTVQRNIGLESASRVLNNDNSELGTIKLTLQKFYRINGGSTQLKGVTPDIILPDQYENLKYREKDNPDAMPWDEIQRAFFTRITPTYDLETIKRRSSVRISQDSSFSAVRSVSAMIEKSNQKVYSLKLDTYRNEQKQMRATFKHLEESNKGHQALTIQMLDSDEKRLSTDNDKLERRKQWIKNLSRDIYISETCKVVSDVISQITLVKGS